MSKKKKIIITSVAVLAVLFLFMSMYTVDLLPATLKGDKQAAQNEKKGKALLQKAWKAHGVDSMNAHQVYQFTAVDTWKGMMGGMAKLWPQEVSKLSIKYVPNTFDAQLTFLDGKTKGQVVGMQSWNYYEKPVGGKINFDVEDNGRHIFGMAAFQYFTELAGRLSGAELIRYIGETTFKEKAYHQIFATWGSLEGNAEHDQYIIYLNQKTNLVDYVSYTIRENYLDMPGSGMFYGTMGFSDFRTIDGFQVPFTQSVFMNGPSENNDDFIHQLKLESFSFDGFELAELYPNKSIQAGGDSK